MEPCGECKWKYPEHLLSQMFIGGGSGTKAGYTKPICGLCALEMTNRELGIRRTHFSGEMAEAMRVDAANWRRAHPEHKPTK